MNIKLNISICTRLSAECFFIFRLLGSHICGVAFTPKITIISEKIFEIDASATLGFEITGSYSHISTADDLSVWHDCESCIDGDLNFKLLIKFSVDLPFVDKLIFKPLDKSIKLSDFYNCEDRDEFGWTECPYTLYRVNLTVQNELKQPLADATLTFPEEANAKILVKERYPEPISELQTDESGKATFYLPAAMCVFIISKEKYETMYFPASLIAFKNTKAVLNGQLAESATVTLANQKQNVTINVTDTDGNPLRHAYVTCGNDALYTDENGQAIFRETGKRALRLAVYYLGYEDYMTNFTSEQEDITKTIQLEKIILSPSDPQNPDDPSGGTVEIVQNRLSLGAAHSAAITDDGSLYMWGDNNYGQLGNGTTTQSKMPIKIMDNVVSVSLGPYHSAAITEDGSLYMWGYNGYRQLGNGTTTQSKMPIKIMDNVVSVSLGSYHSAAITEDGSLYMWGENDDEQLGNQHH